MKYLTTLFLLKVLLFAVIVFHLSVVFKVIPYNIIWGGRLKSDSEMYVFEAISIVINLFLGAVLRMKHNKMKASVGTKTIDLILRIFLVLFALNTIVNACAKTIFEKSFAVLTLTFVILIWKLLTINNYTKIR